ncbi:MAG: DsbA family protein [Proteobacteria bacterium]|nr:DsbA family protein [Pseudomonadota bacterium]
MRLPAALLAAALAAVLAVAALAAPGPAADAEGSQPAFVHVGLDPREYSIGRSDAPLTLLEFTDYQCPYCRKFHAETWPLLKKNWIDTGRLRFVVRDLPLEFHAAAMPAAQAAHCAGEQGKFWEMHDALLSGDDPLATGGIERRAVKLGLDVERLHACTRANRYEGDIARNIAAADALHIHGTPAFVIGISRGNALEGQLVSGAQPYEDFDAALQQLLASRH